jgi:RNA polymerase primary sigma factor
MIAVSLTNEPVTCRLGENSAVGCRHAFWGVHRSSKPRFDPEELTTPSDDELAPAEHARNDKATNRGEANFETDARAVSRGESLAERGDTIIMLYLREIGRVTLLTPQEELDLAARIKNGDGEARERMIRANLRLVVKIARAYEGLGMPLLDLISEGNIGLMKAVERFDPGKGGKLSTYGAFWIKHAITRALACQSRATRLPTHVMEKLFRIRRISVRLEEELGREATHEELAEELGTTSFGLARMRMAAMGPVSLDAPVAGEDSRSYAETIADEQAETPYQKLESEAVRTMVAKVIETLTRQEQTVLCKRFGLNGHESRSLGQIGKELHITYERVRQIQCFALVKLRRGIKKWEQTEPTRKT